MLAIATCCGAACAVLCCAVLCCAVLCCVVPQRLLCQNIQVLLFFDINCRHHTSQTGQATVSYHVHDASNMPGKPPPLILFDLASSGTQPSLDRKHAYASRAARHDLFCAFCVQAEPTTPAASSSQASRPKTPDAKAGTSASSSLGCFGMGKTVEEAEREEMPSGVVGLRNLGERTAEAMSAMCLCLPNSLAELLLLLLLLLCCYLAPTW